MRRAAVAAAVLLLAACAPTDPAAYMPATTTTIPQPEPPRTTTTTSTTSTTTTTSPPTTTAPPTAPTPTNPPVVEPVETTRISPTTTVVSTSSTTVAPTTTTTTATTTTIRPAPPVAPAAAQPPSTSGLQTSCRNVVHIGDSTGVGMWTAADMGGDPATTMDARYRSIGVQNIYPDNSGGRAIVERMPGQANAVEVAQGALSGGYSGCWVIMVGTNDAANVGAGGTPGADQRIARLLDTIGNQPVLWVNVTSRSADPVYGAAVMYEFDAALDRALGTYPNLRVLNWASLVQPDWFANDGLHYSTLGRAWRAAVTAQALALAFPADDGYAGD